MTIVSRIATAIPIGISVLRPSARLEPPTATTKRISSVAYAVDEMASDENTARAMVFGMRWCSISVVASGRPTRTRLTNATSQILRAPGNDRLGTACHPPTAHYRFADPPSSGVHRLHAPGGCSIAFLGPDIGGRPGARRRRRMR